VRRILIVANRTLGGETLLDVVRERIRQGPCEFWVVVPATPSTRPAPRRSPGGSRIPAADVPSATLVKIDHVAARRRLEEGLTQLREAGARVDGIVVDGPPLRAIAECVAHQRLDEIILATLPRRAPRWWRRDPARLIQRQHGLPATLIAAAADLPRYFRVPEPMESARRGAPPPV